MAIETRYKQRDALGYAKVTQAAESAIKSSSVTVTSSNTALPATALTNRRRLYIKNTTDTVFYIGDTDTGNEPKGYPLRLNQEVVIHVAGVTIYARTQSGTATAKVLEIA
jgi:hypothetical protein